MNWDRIEGNWKQFKGTIKQRWGRITGDHFSVIAGKRDELSGQIQESYGIAMGESRKQLSEQQDLQKQ